VFKSGRDKGGNGKNDSQNFIGGAPSANAEPDSEADQSITQNTQNNRLSKSKSDFMVGDIKRVQANRATVKFPLTAEKH
jgi:hypothetical protein